MSPAKVSDEVAELLKRKEKLEAKLKAAQERQKEQERLENDKRKLLAGAVVLDFMAANPADALTVRLSELLANQLTRPADRALFPALPDIQGSGKPAMGTEG